jgi:hypothetical protein
LKTFLAALAEDFTTSLFWLHHLRFETMEHGGEYPDTMPQAIRLTTLRAGPATPCRSRKTAA